jgi:serine/threonine protein kinase
VHGLNATVEALNQARSALELRCGELDRRQSELLALLSDLDPRIPLNPADFLRTLLKQPSDYDRRREIHRDPVAQWFLAVERASGKEFSLGVNAEIRDPRERRSFIRCVAVPLVLNLARVVRTVGFFVSSDNEAGIVAEWVPNETLEDALRQLRSGDPPEGFGPTALSKCLFGSAFVMAQFHARGGIHRNLSPSAIFLDSRMEPVIGGLSYAKIVRDPLKMTMAIGTPFFMAPELFGENDTYDCAVDVFAFAVIVCELFQPCTAMADGQPFRSRQQVMMKIARGDRYRRPDGMPDGLWSLVTECWAQEASDRPTFVAIVDRLKGSRAWMIPGTDAAVYEEFQRRVAGEFSPPARPADLPDALCEALGWELEDA